MNVRRQYIGLAVVLVLETLFFAVLCNVSLSLPLAGSIGCFVSAAVVFFYSVRHSTPFAVITDLYNALLLGYFVQTLELPAVLVFFIVSGASPYIEQLSPGLARFIFAAVYAATVICLSLLSRGTHVPGLGGLLCYVLSAAVIGLIGSRFIIRPSMLKAEHHE